MVNWLLNKNHSILLALLCFLTQWGFAQRPQISRLEIANSEFDFHIRKIEQDDRGYLWLGSDAGIIRFDGIGHQLFPFPDSLLADGNEITDIAISKGVLYAGLASGHLVEIQTLKNQAYKIYKIDNSSILSLSIDSDEKCWIGTNGSGVFLKSGDQIENLTQTFQIADNVVHAIALTDQFVFMGTDLGLIKANRNRSQGSTLYGREEGLSDNLVLSLSPIEKSQLLLGMHNGTACVFDYQQNKVQQQFDLSSEISSPIHCISTPGNYRFLLNDNDELYLVHDSYKVQQFSLRSIGGFQWQPITDFIISKEGNFIGTNSTGFLIEADFSIISIELHDGISFSQAHAIVTDSEGNLWMANDSGIYEHASDFSNDQLITEHYKMPQNKSGVISLCDGLNNDLWFGTFGSGLGKLDKSTNKVVWFTEEDGLTNNNVISIALQGNQLWMATLGGACLMTETNGKPIFTPFSKESALGSNYVYSVFCDNRNRVWFGTDGKGIAYYENNQFHFLNDQFAHCGKSVVSISEDKDGRIWFYSTQQGLQCYDGSQLHSLSISSGRKRAEIYSLTSTSAGEIMLLTSEGLAIADLRVGVRFIHRNLKTSTNYINTIAHDGNGRMWLATDNAVVRYEEFDFVKVSQPQTYIEDILLYLQPFDTSNHNFTSNENHLTFDIVGIWLQDPQSVVYQYKLEGYDLDWVNTKDRRIVFARLPAGDYQFMIRSSHDGSWENSKIASYKFKVRNPFWQTWWFSLFVTAIVIIISYILLQLRWRNLQRTESIQRERIQSQFETLRNQVNPHFLFNSFNTLISTIGKSQSDAIDYVENLSDYFRIVLEQRDKEVIRMKEELELVRHYLFLQQKRFGDNLKVEIKISEDIDETIIPPLSLQLLVENALKHNIISKLKPLTVRIYSEGSWIVIANTLQERIHKERSTGVGLENIKNRYRILFKREVEVQSTESEFLVKLPLIPTS